MHCVARVACCRGGAEPPAPCERERCAWLRDTFHLAEWGGGGVRQWGAAPHNNTTSRLPVLLLDPGAELDIKITFTPKEPSVFAAYLYLRYFMQ